MNFLVMDCGLYVEQANALSANGKNKVKYWTPWESSQKFEDYAIGKGFGNLEKIMYLADYYKWADCIVNFDVRFNDTIAFLREIYPNKSIFGSGHGEKLENDRWGLKKIIKDVGLPLHKAVKIKGITELKNHLKINKDKFIKINVFREDVESFYSKDYESIELILDELESSFGPFKEEYEFVVEDAIHTDVEIGFDGFFNGIDYIKPFFYGYEYHKSLYIAKVSDSLPSSLQETMTKLKPVLRKIDYRGALSTEEKIVNNKEHYFLDICCRLPAPLSALYQEYILNWDEVIYKIGKKENVRLDIKNKYIGSLPLISSHAEHHWLKIDIDKKDRSNIKFRSVSQNNNKFYSIKGPIDPVVIVASGNSVDEVLETLKKYSTKVNAYGLNRDSANGIDKIKDIIQKGKQVGIDF